MRKVVTACMTEVLLSERNRKRIAEEGGKRERVKNGKMLEISKQEIRKVKRIQSSKIGQKITTVYLYSYLAQNLPSGGYKYRDPRKKILIMRDQLHQRKITRNMETFKKNTRITTYNQYCIQFSFNAIYRENLPKPHVQLCPEDCNQARASGVRMSGARRSDGEGGPVWSEAGRG